MTHDVTMRAKIDNDKVLDKFSGGTFARAAN